MTASKDDSFSLRSFLTQEDGAVTADWVVLAAAVALLSIPLMATISTSTQTATDGIAEDVVAASDQN